jgi:hypothetical protein
MQEQDITVKQPGFPPFCPYNLKDMDSIHSFADNIVVKIMRKIGTEKLAS